MELDTDHKIKGIHHIGFVVSDLSLSIDFYKLLGFSVRDQWIERPEECAEGLGVSGAEIELASLQGYQTFLELIQYHKSKGNLEPSPANKIGNGHISLETDDLEGLYADLTIKGITFVSRIIHYPTASWVQTEDPDGIRVELIQIHDS